MPGRRTRIRSRRPAGRATDMDSRAVLDAAAGTVARILNRHVERDADRNGAVLLQRQRGRHGIADGRAAIQPVDLPGRHHAAGVPLAGLELRHVQHRPARDLVERDGRQRHYRGRSSPGRCRPAWRCEPTRRPTFNPARAPASSALRRRPATTRSRSGSRVRARSPIRLPPSRVIGLVSKDNQLPDAFVGVPYSYTLSALGNTGSVIWAASVNQPLPRGWP